MQIIPCAAIFGRDIGRREITSRRSEETALYALNLAAIFSLEVIGATTELLFLLCFFYSVSEAL
jgi:hypothetical protein